ncbi:MAG: restriction endonuclease subunit S [Spirochaetales bacterium]|nr:restriction endonuclease subunit S [Spirochaetales bacterium]MCF7938224.1 restriction endonuclease subunit S [Spirochaetales bacterium]
MAKAKSSTSKSSTSKTSTTKSNTAKSNTAKSGTANNNKSSDFVPLSKLANLYRIPPALKSESGKRSKTIKVVTFKDIPNAGFVSEASKTMKLTPETLKKHEKYQLQPYDILMTSAGNLGRTAVVPTDLKGNYLPSQNVFIVRFTEDKEAYAYLFSMYMKSPAGKKIIDSLTTGKTIPRLNVKPFKKAQVPVLTAERKKTSKAAFQKEMKQLERIREIESQIMEIREAFTV